MLVLKCMRAHEMGSLYPGFSLSHVLTAIVGYLARQVLHDQSAFEQSLSRALAEQTSAAGTQCAEACASNCGCCEAVPSTHYHLKLAFSIGGGLISFFLFVAWFCRRSQKTRVSRKSDLTLEEESSPDSLSQKRFRAQLQLAEVKARARRHGTD